MESRSIKSKSDSHERSHSPIETHWNLDVPTMTETDNFGTPNEQLKRKIEK